MLAEIHNWCQRSCCRDQQYAAQSFLIYPINLRVYMQWGELWAIAIFVLERAIRITRKYSGRIVSCI